MKKKLNLLYFSLFFCFISNQIVSSFITLLTGALSTYFPVSIVLPLGIFLQQIIVGMMNSNYWKSMFPTDLNPFANKKGFM